jgi:hypothetical protein
MQCRSSKGGSITSEAIRASNCSSFLAVGLDVARLGEMGEAVDATAQSWSSAGGWVSWSQASHLDRSGTM